MVSSPNKKDDFSGKNYKELSDAEILPQHGNFVIKKVLQHGVDHLLIVLQDSYIKAKGRGRSEVKNGEESGVKRKEHLMITRLVGLTWEIEDPRRRSGNRRHHPQISALPVVRISSQFFNQHRKGEARRHAAFYCIWC